MSDKSSDLAENYKFFKLCEFLEKLKNANPIQKKERVLLNFIANFKKIQTDFIKEKGPNSDASFYCILRTLLPHQDNKRSSYNLKQTSLAQLLVKILNIPANSNDAQKLFFKACVQGARDLSDRVYDVVKSRANSEPSKFTLGNVHRLLDILASDNRKTQEYELTRFFNQSCSLEQKWLVSLILKQMHLGIGEQKIFAAYDKYAKQHYARHSCLRKVCEAVERGEKIEVNDLEGIIAPFYHIKPMLCENVHQTKLESIIKNDVFYLETKMDGERFQIHMLNDTFKYISRSGKDFTTSFGESIIEGNLTPYLKRLFKINMKSLIIDGEMMVWDKSSSIYRVKGEHFNVRNLPNHGNLRPCFVVYDLLYLNDTNYLDKAYVERIAMLHKIFKEEEGILKFCKRIKVENVTHFIDLFNEAINGDEEGVVLKKQSTKYRPGLRENGGWYKVKPDYIKGIVSDMDLLIVGGFYNRSETYIESFLLAVCEKVSDNSEDEFIFKTVAKVHMGLSHNERYSLNEELKKYWKKGILPVNIKCGTTKPDVWIEPKNSIILQIRATELQQTLSFGASYCLRFPRIEYVRRDKIWSECMTLKEYEEFFKGNAGVKKITKRGLTADDLLPSRNIGTCKRLKSSVNPYITVFRPEDVQNVSSALEGLSICILSTYRNGEYSKYTLEDLKEIIVKHGGKIVENPLQNSKTCFSVAGDITMRVRGIRNNGSYNIITLTWLIKSFSGDIINEKYIQPKPRDMIATTKEMDEEFQKLFDSFGDSYADDVDEDELKHILEEIPKEKCPHLTSSEIEELEDEIYSSNVENGNIFRHIIGCFYHKFNKEQEEKRNSRMMFISELIFQSKRGIKFVDGKPELLPNNNSNKRIYVFVDKRTQMDKEDFEEWFQKNLSGFTNKEEVNIIAIEWILDCDREKRLVNINNYKVTFEK